MTASASRLSVWSAGLFLPLNLLVGQSLALYLKSSNPDNVDVTQGLAYLRPILLTSLTLLVVTWLFSLTTGLKGLKSDDPSTARMGLGLLAVITVLSLVLAAVNGSLVDITDPD